MVISNNQNRFHEIEKLENWARGLDKVADKAEIKENLNGTDFVLTLLGTTKESDKNFQKCTRNIKVFPGKS